MTLTPCRNFYSHAPRGARPFYLWVHGGDDTFLLTRPSRGATGCGLPGNALEENFYSHAPRGARPLTRRCYGSDASISTHTPLAGRDAPSHCGHRDGTDFYSHAPRGARLRLDGYIDRVQAFLLTRPSRGATRLSRTIWERYMIISTHTPLAGRDALTSNTAKVIGDFYSHAPRGARPERAISNTDGR